MLTKTDLNQIGQIIDERLEKGLKPIKKDMSGMKQDVGTLKQDVGDLQKDMKYLKKKINRIDKTVSLTVRNYDEGDVRLERRVGKIEEHIGLTS